MTYRVLTEKGEVAKDLSKRMAIKLARWQLESGRQWFRIIDDVGHTLRWAPRVKCWVSVPEHVAADSVTSTDLLEGRVRLVHAQLAVVSDAVH